MTIPAAMFIEMAAEALKARAAADPPMSPLEGIAGLRDELRELREYALVPGGIASVATVPFAVPFEVGYLLGLETARVLLAGNPAAVKAGVLL